MFPQGRNYLALKSKSGQLSLLKDPRAILHNFDVLDQNLVDIYKHSEGGVGSLIMNSSPMTVEMFSSPFSRSLGIVPRYSRFIYIYIL